MATVTPTSVPLTGVAAAGSSAAGGGDTVPNQGGNVMLRVTNGGGSDITLSIGGGKVRPADNQFPAMTLTALSVTIAAGTTKYIGPVPKAYNDSSDNLLLTWSAVTSVNFLPFVAA